MNIEDINKLLSLGVYYNNIEMILILLKNGATQYIGNTHTLNPKILHLFTEYNINVIHITGLPSPVVPSGSQEPVPFIGPTGM